MRQPASTNRPSTPNTTPPTPPQSLSDVLYAFWKFSRPHTVIGTTLSVLSLVTLAGILSDINSTPIEPIGWAVLWALVACLAGNIYIVGLNQLEDVDIDRINKPHLPLASEEFTRQQAQWIVGLCGAIALLLSAFQGQFLMATVWLSLLIGTAYSLPPVRLKRFPFFASLCIFVVRGVIVNLGLFLHFQEKWGDLSRVPPAIWALTGFILVFTFAIAIFKDIPDLEGDRRYNITTFTVQLGQRAVFKLARWVLTACYLGMIAAALLLPRIHAPFIVITHGLLLAVLWWLSLGVDLRNQRAIARFYQFIWKLFFLEYLLFPLACAIAWWNSTSP